MKKSFLFISCFAAAMAFSAAAFAAPPPTTMALQSHVAVAEMSAPSHALVLVANATTPTLAVFAQDVLTSRERMPAESLVAQAITVVARSKGNSDVSLTKTGIHADQEAEVQRQAQTIT